MDGLAWLNPDLIYWRGTDGTRRAEEGLVDISAVRRRVAPRALTGPRDKPLEKRDGRFAPGTFPPKWASVSEDRAYDVFFRE
eukprot:15467273-Alexandrium_andersonii.AAC.1